MNRNLVLFFKCIINIHQCFSWSMGTKITSWAKISTFLVHRRRPAWPLFNSWGIKKVSIEKLLDKLLVRINFAFWSVQLEVACRNLSHYHWAICRRPMFLNLSGQYRSWIWRRLSGGGKINVILELCCPDHKKNPISFSSNWEKWRFFKMKYGFLYEF
jgi:hypothetical protein